MHYATGLMAPGETEGSGWNGGNGFVHPMCYRGIIDKEHFKRVSLDNLEPGDILMTSENSYPHVAIYVGNGQMVDMVHGGVQYRNKDVVNSWRDYSWGEAARLTSLDGANPNPIEGGTEITPTPTPNPNEQPSPGTAETTKPDHVDLDKLEFELNGMPMTVKNAGGHSIMYYINKIGEAFDYLFGVILNGFKVVPAGMVAGLETWITSVFNSLNTV